MPSNVNHYWNSIKSWPEKYIFCLILKGKMLIYFCIFLMSTLFRDDWPKENNNIYPNFAKVDEYIYIILFGGKLLHRSDYYNSVKMFKTTLDPPHLKTHLHTLLNPEKFFLKTPLNDKKQKKIYIYSSHILKCL